MTKFKAIAIIVIPLFILILLLIFGNVDIFKDKINLWAGISTYLGLGLSIISVFYIYLTYRSQMTFSASLQLDSTFFQWFEIHRELCNKLEKEINDFANDEVLPFLKKQNKFAIEQFLNRPESKQRCVIQYYRSMFHMLKYIHHNPILENKADKKKYYDIIQSAMSDSELQTFVFLLLSDKNLNTTGTLKNSTLKDLVDEAHLVKNIYYPKDYPNSKAFYSFIRATFPKTVGSMHF